ncbi:MAG: hypothetical protein SFY67_02350 [Candidatus Melainabacteria bacterium]|nr:hypothetical protein [Candidatus Melainabacteria bacterium]
MKLKSLGTSIWFAALAILLFCYSSAIAEDKLTPSSDPEKFKAKLEELDKTIKESPSSLDYAAKANLYVIWHKPVEALDAINKAIEMDPDDAGYYAYRGLINLKLSNNDKAILDIQKAHSMGRKNWKTLGYLSFLQIQKNNFAEAKMNALSSLKQNPKNYLALFVKGYLENRDGNYDQAINDLSTAIQIRPDVPDFFVERAKSWKYLGQSIKANEDLTKAKKLSADLFN